MCNRNKKSITHIKSKANKSLSLPLFKKNNFTQAIQYAYFLRSIFGFFKLKFVLRKYCMQ